MNLTTREDNGRTVILVGEKRVDSVIALRFKDRLREMIGQAQPIVELDLSAVDFIDSSGLGAVIAVRKTLPAGRTLELSGLTSSVARVFRLTRMDMMFTIVARAPHDGAPNRNDAP